jgi:hypothetical protein
MDKLNTTEIKDALKDVRSAYRLLALYQRRLLDVVNYIATSYSVNFVSGWSKFSAPAAHGNRANIDCLSWDWLTLYLYEFNLGTIKFEGQEYHFKIVHQADTGFYDENQHAKISKKNPDQFGYVNNSSTRLFFILSENEDGYPVEKILHGNLAAEQKTKIVKGKWLAVPFDFERFSNQQSTDIVLKEFNNICKETYGLDLMAVKSIKE